MAALAPLRSDQACWDFGYPRIAIESARFPVEDPAPARSSAPGKSEIRLRNFVVIPHRRGVLDRLWFQIPFRRGVLAAISRIGAEPFPLRCGVNPAPVGRYPLKNPYVIRHIPLSQRSISLLLDSISNLVRAAPQSRRVDFAKMLCMNIDSGQDFTFLSVAATHVTRLVDASAARSNHPGHIPIGGANAPGWLRRHLVLTAFPLASRINALPFGVQP
jgi:hypothetical protein